MINKNSGDLQNNIQLIAEFQTKGRVNTSALREKLKNPHANPRLQRIVH